MTETVKVEGGHWQETEETVNKWWGGHWQKTEETMTLVGWPLAEDRGDSDKWWGGHWQKTEETVKSGGVATGRRQRRQ